MAYRWGLEGPAFEFPTPYRIENRFLKLRGWALIVLALLLLLVITVVPDSGAAASLTLPGADLMSDVPVPGSAWPHLGAALLLGALGGWELFRASRQRQLLLTPGQPASLTTEVRREAVGSSSGAAWLMQALSEGAAAPMALRSPYARWLAALAPQLGHAPSSLAGHLCIRIAHLLVAAGLLVLTALAWAVPSVPGAQALAVLVYGALGAALVARSAQGPDKATLGPLTVLAALVAALLLSLPAWWFAAIVPRFGVLDQLLLPAATISLLLGLIVLELIGLGAARAFVDVPAPSAPVAPEQAELPVDFEPTALMRELDLELHRRWTEGIPNRRHAWQPPLPDPNAEAAGFTAVVLEESQPLLPGDPRAPAAAPRRRGWLWCLGLLGLACTLAGAALWVRLGYLHMKDVNASWATAAFGLALLILGGHAQRLTHLLWSRVETESIVTWLELHSAAGAASVRARVARVRSVFYAAAQHQIGSRTLLALHNDATAARAWTQQIQALAVVGAAEAIQRQPVRPRETRPGPLPATPAHAPARPAKFCAACGTPVTAGARFCQNCGAALG